MASVMAIGSEVIGSCVGEINVSVGMGKNRCLALLWVELVENSFGGESGSSLATKGLDGPGIGSRLGLVRGWMKK